MSELSEQDFIKIVDLCKLDEVEGEEFRQCMRKTKVHRLKIRQTLCEEGKGCHEAFYLLEGTVNLTICLANGERIILSQVGKGELLNLELILNDWRSKYTIVVCSSFIRYVVFEDREIVMLTEHIREDIEANYCFREREVGSKNRRIAEEERSRKMRQTIDKMSLPSINLQSLKKKELVSHVSEELIQNKGQFGSRIITDKIGSVKMSKQLHSGSQPRYKLGNHQYPSIQINDNQKLQTDSQELIPPIQSKKRLAEFKLQRLNSERSASLHAHANQETNRNERLFKSQLKHIVKRKLLFERKHFQILQKIAYKESKPAMQKVHTKNQEGSPLDNYFNL